MKTYLTLLGLFFSLALFAQLERGQWWLNGELSYEHEDKIEERRINIISPGFALLNDTVLFFSKNFHDFEARIGLLKVLNPTSQLAFSANYSPYNSTYESLNFPFK